jgi:hypothetical protein
MILREYMQGVVGEKEAEKFKRLTGPFIEADKVNLNKRRYPFDTVWTMIQEARKRLKEGSSLYGQLGHPAKEADIGLTSHLIDKLDIDGKVGHFSSKILETSRGLTLRRLLEGGAKLGCSLRALGDVKVDKDGIEIVQEGCRLISIDVVESPSFQFYPVMESTLYESQKFVLNEEQILWEKYRLATLAGYKGDWEQFKLYEENQDLLDIFYFAQRCGDNRTFEEFVKSRRK